MKGAQMTGRVAAVVAACALSVGMIVALVPHPDEFMLARLKDASPAETVRLLEASRRDNPSDAALASRLAFAYEGSGKPAPGLWCLADVARARALTPTERALAVRLGYAVGKPAEALAVLSGPHEHLTPKQHAELVALALAAGQPRLALSHQAALAKAAPSPAAFARWRDLAIAASDMPEALRIQRQLAAHDDPAALERLATLSLQANDPKGALEAAERRLKLADSPTWRQKAADFAMWAKLPARAVPPRMALFAHAPTPEAGLTLARLLDSTGAVEALPFARALEARFPAHAGAFDHLLGLLTRGHRLDEARTLLAERATRWPDDGRVHTQRVDYLLGQGDRQGALGELSRWLGRHKADRRARHQLAVVQVWDGKPQAGWKTYESLLADSSGPMDALETTWREEWAKVSGVLDDFTPEGHDNLAALAMAKPADAAIWRRLAVSENESGDRPAAIRAQRHVVALGESTGQDALRLAEWLLWNDQVSEGLGLLKELDARAPLPKDALEDAADRAAKVWRFDDAAFFLEKLADREPKNVEAVEALARAKEAAGDLPGAEAAYRRRLAMPGADASIRMLTAGIALKRHRPDAALAYVSVADATVGELQLQSYLAVKLNRPDAQAAALRKLVAKTPADWESRLTLADLAAKRGRATEAAAQEAAAIALRPHDARLIARLASRRLYGPDAEAAAPYVALLEKAADPGVEGERILADYYQGRDARKAATALDKLHAAGAGDAETYFRRGELAAQAQDGATAEASFTAAAAAGLKATEVGAREAAAYAYERLGRDTDADALWARLRTDYPDRPSPQVALARRALARGDLGATASLLASAEAIAPDSTEVKLLRAEWLRASGRTEEAADAFAALRRAEPGLRYLAAAEGMARHDMGDWGRARALVRDAVAAAPSDKDLLDAHRQVRDLGASRVEAVAFQEAAGNLERNRLGLSSVQRLGDRMRLLTDVSTLSWSGGALQSRELKLGARWSKPGLDVNGSLGLQTGLSAPVGGVGISLGGPTGLRGEARVESVRWEDSNATVLANGREHRATAELGWQPDPRFGVRVGGGVGQLNADGHGAAVSASGLVEAVVRPQAYSPFMAAYQLQHRHWGAIGASMGLADDLTLHSVLVGYDGRLGPLRLEVRPGLMHDLRGGGIAPLAGGNLAWELGADHELQLQGLWAGRSFNTGVDGTYHQVNLTGQWYF